MTTTKQQQPTSAKSLAEERLAPIRLWAHAERGTINRLVNQLAELSGEAVTRQTVSRWLSKNPAVRQVPSYGWGLHLEEAYRKLC
tara:strand:- start:13946 stop:14200 length:255 start_codon:yes stop_codon:yes gene_type:complete